MDEVINDIIEIDGCSVAKQRNSASLQIIILLLLFINIAKQLYFDYCLSFYSSTTKGNLFNLCLTIFLTFIILAVALRSTNRLLFIFIYLAQSLYLIVNITYFGYFHNYLFWGTVVGLFNEGAKAASHFAIPIYSKQFAMLVDLPLFLVTVYHWPSIKHNGSAIVQKVSIAACMLLGVLLALAWSQGKMPWQIYKRTGELGVVQKFGLLSLQTTDLIMTSRVAPNFNYGPLMLSNGEPSPHPNIIQIQVESLDAGVVGRSYKGKLVAPFLTELASKSLYYPYAMSYHLAGGSSDAEFAIMNGIEPLHNIPSLRLPHYRFDNSFVKILRDNGYQTLAFHGNAETYYNRGYAYRQMGFNDFYDLKKMGLKEPMWGATDEDLFRFVANQTKNAIEPYFFQIITLSSHEPFIYVPSHTNLLFEDISDITTRNYYNSIHYVDAQLKLFFKNSDLRNTYVILYGDHTAGVSSNIYHSSSYIEQNRKFEFVPLIIVTPEGKRYKETSSAVSFLDVGETVLNLSGVAYRCRFNGEDLTSSNHSLKSKISFLGGSFDRKGLFKKINFYANY